MPTVWQARGWRRSFWRVTPEFGRFDRRHSLPGEFDMGSTSAALLACRIVEHRLIGSAAQIQCTEAIHGHA